MVHTDEDISSPSDVSQPSIDCATRSEPSSAIFPVAHPASEPSSFPSDLSLRRRSSAFVEVGLSGDDAILDAKLKKVESRPRMQVRFRSEIEFHEPEDKETAFDSDRQPSFATHFAAPSFAFPSMPQLFLLSLLLALALPSLYNSPFFKAGISPIGAKAGTIKTSLEPEIRTLPEELVGRDNSPVNICTRWSQQTAVVNGTLYIYGGRAKTQPSQTSNTWSRSPASFLNALH
jgi:hypothetical protein